MNRVEETASSPSALLSGAEQRWRAWFGQHSVPVLAGLASLDDDEKTLLLGALRQTVLGEAGRLCRLIELFPAATVVCLSRVAMEYYATHTAQLEKSHKEWKGTAMDNGVQTFVSTRYVPKVAERINVLNGRGKARLIDSQLT